MHLVPNTNEIGDLKQLRIMVPYPRTSIGGIETLTCSIINELAGLVDAVVWVLPDSLRHLAQSLKSSGRLVVESSEWPPGSMQAYSGVLSRWLPEAFRRHDSSDQARSLTTGKLQQRLEHLIKKHRISHCLFTWIPWGLAVPRLRVPVVAIVHDRNWSRFPENFVNYSPALLDGNLKEWVQCAHAIVTPSRLVQTEVRELAPQFGAKVKVVPEAAGIVIHESRQYDQQGTASDTTPIFYYPGTAGAHKGHLTLFEATLKLASAGHQFKVVLTGDRTELLTGCQPAPIPQVEQCRNFYLKHEDILQQHIESLGFCDKQQVEKLYSSSRRVVLPSRYEGFGLPLIESIARGCRVICSDIEPYQEQIEQFRCADFVQVFPAGEFQALASYMERSLLDSDPRRISAGEAEAVAGRWTWRDAAGAILSILEETSGSAS